jgi:hypothetical protein
MNHGAKHATAKVLYFLHADSTPPKDFDVYIINSVKDGYLAGCFRMQFDSQHPWMKFIGWLTKFNLRACRGGDQSLFVSTILFNEIGGYDEDYHIFEDHQIIAQLYKKTKFKVIQRTLITSSRRFEDKGILKLQLLYLSIYFKNWLGAEPDELYRFYLKHVN